GASRGRSRPAQVGHCTRTRERDQALAVSALPDGNGLLQPIDEIAARGERLVTMRRVHFHDERQTADGNHAGSVLDDDAIDAKARRDLVEDLLELALRHLPIRGVVEPSDLATLLKPAHA